MNHSEHHPVTITIDREHLDALCQNTEWSLRFAELYEDGDPVEEVPVWATIAQLRTELDLEPLAADDLPQPQEWVPDFAAAVDQEENVKLRTEIQMLKMAIWRLAIELGLADAAKVDALDALRLLNERISPHVRPAKDLNDRTYQEWLGVVGSDSPWDVSKIIAPDDEAAIAIARQAAANESIKAEVVIEVMELYEVRKVPLTPEDKHRGRPETSGEFRRSVEESRDKWDETPGSEDDE